MIPRIPNSTIAILFLIVLKIAQILYFPFALISGLIIVYFETGYTIFSEGILTSNHKNEDLVWFIIKDISWSFENFSILLANIFFLFFLRQKFLKSWFKCIVIIGTLGLIQLYFLVGRFNTINQFKSPEALANFFQCVDNKSEYWSFHIPFIIAIFYYLFILFGKGILLIKNRYY